MRHENDGNCQKCEQIFTRYPGFHAGLRKWFKDLQAKVPTAHISCAGRGQQDQEECVRRGASRAHWSKSAHNWNAAIDIFEMGGKSTTDLYERAWYNEHVAKSIPDDLEWYGAPGASFPELPHVQLRGWKLLANAGKLKLVE
jgi:hypothetical protein